MRTLCITILSFYFFLPNLIYSQYYSPGGGRAHAFCGASLNLEDEWSLNNNQAGMAFLTSPSFSMGSENRFMLKELGTHTLGITLPTRIGVFGISSAWSGDRLYSVFSPAIAYGLKLTDHFAAGIRLDIFRTALAEGYGNKLSPVGELGMLLHINKQLVFGAHVFNPGMIRLSKFSDERIPTYMRAGILYSFTRNLMTLLEVHKCSLQPLDLVSGLEYRLNKRVVARLGTATSPFRYSFGFGILTKNFSIDISSRYQQLLGFSTAISVQFQFKR